MRRHVGEVGRGLAGGGRRVDVENPAPNPTPEQLQQAKQADRIRDMEQLMRCAVGFARGESSQ
jgi:hypothetical protein